MSGKMLIEDRDIKRLMKLSGVGKFTKKVLSEKKLREEKEQVEEEKSCNCEEGKCTCEETIDETVNVGSGEKLTGKVGTGAKSATVAKIPDNKTPKQIPGGNKGGDKMKPGSTSQSSKLRKESRELDADIERLLREIDEYQEDDEETQDMGGEEDFGGDVGGEMPEETPEVSPTSGTEKDSLKAFLQKVAEAAKETLGIEIEVQDDAGGEMGGEEDFGGEMPEMGGEDEPDGDEFGGEMPEEVPEEEGGFPPKNQAQLKEAHERLVKRITKEVHAKLVAAQRKSQSRKK